MMHTNNYRITGRMLTETTCKHCGGKGCIENETEVTITIEAPAHSNPDELANLAEEAYLRSSNYDSVEWTMPPDELLIEAYDISPAELMRRAGVPTLFDIL